MDERAQIQELFEACVELNASEREQYLIKHCPDDAMRARIQKMLRVHDDTDGGFSKPASEKFRDLLDAPGKQIGDFEIIREAGHGGMSTVFLARDTVLNREVALKVLGADRSLSEVARQRFLHEARAAAGLSHTNIIKIYRYGETDSHGFIAMEYVPGGTLADWISQQDRTTTHGRRKIVEVIASLADGLEHAHQRGVIHRDVKPNNVMIAQDDHPLLGDFGIARIIDTETLTETLAGAGTASYMSPEQIRAKRAAIDHRSDIFSLGIVLYESLGGRLPFTGSSIEDIKNAILFSPAARLRSVTSSLPRDLDVICSKALEKRPADRYPTAGHLAADLRAWLNGEPILARPPSIGRRLGWWARQHQRHALVGTVFLFALLLIITTLVIKAQHNATRAWVKVESKEPVSLLFARHDSATNQIDHSSLTRVENNGSWIRLIPGQYRLTAISNHDEAFCEFNLVLIDVGKAQSLNVHIVRSPEEVQYEPKQVTGVLAHPIDVMEGMIQVSAGIYDQIPSSPSSSHTRSSSVVDTFLIDRTEVSFGDYCTFLDETGFPPSLYWTHFRQLRLPLPSGRSSIMILPPSEDDLYVRINGSSSGTASCIRIHKNAPVFGVTQKDAEAYARWCGKRLPTLAEWHAAARGPHGRLYPTGDTPPDLGDTPVDMSNPVESYLQVVGEVNTPALWDPADGIWHTHSNVSELLATVNLQDRDVYMAGRHWSSPASTTLAEVRTSPMSMPNIRAGFRCAKSIRNSFITKNGE